MNLITFNQGVLDGMENVIALDEEGEKKKLLLDTPEVDPQLLTALL